MFDRFIHSLNKYLLGIYNVPNMGNNQMCDVHQISTFQKFTSSPDRAGDNRPKGEQTQPHDLTIITKKMKQDHMKSRYLESRGILNFALGSQEVFLKDGMD